MVTLFTPSSTSCLLNIVLNIEKLIMIDKQKIKLNLGCGDRTPEEWVNVDYALGARIFKNTAFSRLLIVN